MSIEDMRHPGKKNTGSCKRCGKTTYSWQSIRDGICGMCLRDQRRRPDIRQVRGAGPVMAVRWEILKKHVRDLRGFGNCVMLLRVIGNDFDGAVDAQKDIIGFMHDQHGWGNRTTMKYLSILEDLKLLKCVKKGWTKSYRLLTDGDLFHSVMSQEIEPRSSSASYPPPRISRYLSAIETDTLNEYHSAQGRKGRDASSGSR